MIGIRRSRVTEGTVRHLRFGILLFFLGTCIQAQEPVKPAAAKPPNQVIAEAIELLRAKSYARFFREAIQPEELKRRVGTGTVEAAAADFGRSGEATKLLEVLVAASHSNPAISRDGKALFRLVPAINGKNELTMVKVDGRWYLP